ncbi:MAG: hypothetical protein CMI12_10670 [Oceanospirillum sp.]|nr:hypothetical protein [Oceanospirillum sp.]
MTSRPDFQYFANTQYIQLHDLVTKEQCTEFITAYEQAAGDKSAIDKIIKTCQETVFQGDVDELLRQHFEGDYQIFWTSYDKVDDKATDYDLNLYWHLDYGVKKSLKLFVYLNPVAEHGGNTLIIDQARTESLRKAGALPIESGKRHHDLTEILQGLELDMNTLAYDLDTGDALLFSPFILAHKCQPPKPYTERHTICFLLTPPMG